jgi:hypothetical protein
LVTWLNLKTGRRRAAVGRDFNIEGMGAGVADREDRADILCV